jgi:cardiolipin synthase
VAFLERLERRWRSRPAPFLPGHRVRVLVDGGPYFAALLEAIAAAERSVHLESYILRADRTGWRVARALAERARAGVEVALSIDGFGSLGLDPALLEHLRDAGAKVRVYRPLSVLEGRWPWSRRNHRKLVVVDGRLAIVGGFNLADEYAAPADGGGGWRDTGVEVEGPAVAGLERLFLALWDEEGGPRLSATSPPPPRFAGGEQVRFLGNLEGRERRHVRRAYLLAIVSARRSVRITSAYFIPDRVIRRALIRAARRGVEVEVIVARNTDVPAALEAARAHYERLLAHGVKIHEWHERVLHAKTAVVDGEWCTVGSSNLDFLSSFRNLEVNAAIISRRVGAELEERFAADRARSVRIDLATWKRRPWWRRWLEAALRWLGRGY